MKRHQSRGSALVFVLVISLILGVFAYFISTQQLMGLKKLRIYRMRMARDRIVERLESALSDPAYIRNSRVLVEGFEGQTRFLNCLYMGDDAGKRPDPNCVAGPEAEPKSYDFILFSSAPIHPDPKPSVGYPIEFAYADPSARRLAGPGLKSRYVLYNGDGELCDPQVSAPSEACPFEVQLRFSPSCRGQEVCVNAGSMSISYDVNYLSGGGMLDKIFAVKSIHELGVDPKKESTYWTERTFQRIL